LTLRALLGALAALAVCVPPATHARDGRALPRGYANPSALIAAEIAFAQLAQAKGQWTAFRETAAPDAEMFVPQRVRAQDWLKKRANPPAAVRWQPHEVWMSCDGSFGITRGAWQGAGGGNGYFTTIWQRQEKGGSKGGGYKWVLDQGDALAQPLAPPEMIAGKVADCRPGAGPVPASPPPPGIDAKDGASADRTLQWSSWVWPDGSRAISAWLWNGTGFDPVLNLRVAAAPVG
jgi:hypothetical protein